ncbi:hypothetical protein LR48_Vigan05g069700 [Vigna angularis]|uniref:Uncharacterized protein n=1 Tax=Phaseolus angularis TaxID=3914 RepID=A0A0L9UK10_PHAAN|nr:hypothetical protein LR48_Vigan05g069700 [Vigna angularis]
MQGAEETLTGSHNSSRVRVLGREEEKDGKGRKVHDDLIQAQLKLGTLVRFKNNLWVVKYYKENGVIEIEAPYSRRVKKVDQKQLMSWCDERKRNTNIEDGT